MTMTITMIVMIIHNKKMIFLACAAIITRCV